MKLFAKHVPSFWVPRFLLALELVPIARPSSRLIHRFPARQKALVLWSVMTCRKLTFIDRTGLLLLLGGAPPPPLGSGPAVEFPAVILTLR